MDEIKHHFVQTNGIAMHVHEAGAGYPVVLCHGFPEIWYSWRHQLRALSAAGFRVIAPDQRGYAETSRPDPIEAYNMRNLVADLTGMLDQLGIDRCAIAGHDWGGIVAWGAAMMAPDRIEKVAGLNTPFLPRPPIKPTDLFRAMAGGKFHYILYFQEPGVAEAEFEADVRRTLRGFYQDLADLKLEPGANNPPGVLGPAGGGLLDRLPDRPHGSFLTDADFEVFVAAFERGGFRGPINWYRNFDRNWEESAGLEHRVNQPALMICAERDPVLPPWMAAGMQRLVPNLTRTIVIKECGHWTQQEKPDQVNQALIEFLRA
jgi:soluble epoxide hydrolase / lipid-phosphate phosphatase